MPRISARFEFFLNLEPRYLAQINSSYYSLKANLMQGEESILWFPLERRIFENQNNRVSEVYVTADGKFNVNGIFFCKLREGVAPWIQLKKKKFSLNILATHLVNFYRVSGFWRAIRLSYNLWRRGHCRSNYSTRILREKVKNKVPIEVLGFSERASPLGKNI